MLPPQSPASLRVVRLANQAAVLWVLRHLGPCSRSRIAHLTGLSLPAVSRIVDELREQGLVIEEGRGESAGGRPPILLRFHAKAAAVLAVEVGADRVRGVLADLGGVPLAEASVPGRPDELAEAVERLEERLAGAPGTPPLRAVGLAVPGIVDRESGTVIYANRLALRDEPLGPRLGRRLERPVVLENDVNAMLLAEVCWGAGRGLRHAVLLHVGEGIGAGLLVDGRLHTGHGSAAGEVGYLVVDGAGAHPGRGPRGSFEFRYSASAACARAGVPDAPTLFARAAAEDPRAAGVLADLERGLAAGCANLTAVLAPEAVICSGPLFDAGGDPWLERIAAHLAGLVPRPPRLLRARLGRDAAVLGAVARALEAIGLDPEAGALAAAAARE